MDVRVAVTGADTAADLESLRDWLTGVDEFRGRVVGVQAPPPAGALGPVLDSVLVALGPGGAVAVFATALVSWLRHRGGSVKIRVELPDGRSVLLDADRVRGLSPAQLRALLDTVAGMVRQAGGGVAGAAGEVAAEAD